VTALASRPQHRIAVITTSYPSDGDDVAGHFVRAEVRRHTINGHRVTVFAPAAQRNPEIFEEDVVGLAHFGAFGSPGAAARLRFRPDRWLGAALFALEARRTLFEHGPFDEIIAHFLLPSYWPICEGHSALSRVVVHGSDLRLLERLPGVLRGHVLACMKKDNPTIQCVSQALADRLNRLTSGQLHSRICVEASPIELPELPSKAQLRQKLGVGDERIIVVVARLIKSKRVDVALRAALQVPGARIVVCGDGPEHRRLTHLFPTVAFLGQVARGQALTWMGAADVLLSASREEGAPTAIREARALGVPVVATAAGDLAKWAETDPDLHIVP
jgi:teichuronic acid biosynthesis glycosyltransferase TuaC